MDIIWTDSKFGFVILKEPLQGPGGTLQRKCLLLLEPVFRLPGTTNDQLEPLNVPLFFSLVLMRQ